MAEQTSSEQSRNMILQAIFGVVVIQLLYWICREAYDIRMYAVKEYGRIIHEFDPYFNYRATEYLYANGWYKFRTWFDYKVWYPLGRPVGTTIYPGMQVTAVLLKNFLLANWSINDICVLIPAWFGVTATLSVAWLAYECTRDSKTFGTILLPSSISKQWIQPLINRIVPDSFGLTHSNSRVSSLIAPFCSVFAAAIMAIVPAHLLRSIAGGYDNESIAMTAMCFTFACWCWSLRDDVSSPLYTVVAAVCTGLAYFYMVAAWGGYIFVLNLIGVHATCLVLFGRYSSKLYRAYTVFYLVGTFLAIQVPVVGWTPLKSLEQLGPLLTFASIQLIEVCEVMKRRRNLSVKQTWTLRVVVFGTAAAVGFVLLLLLASTGYFGPISSRVRGLFVKHTKTGNPLVDSVAEHQAASPQAYFQYLHDISYLAPVGILMTALLFFNDSSSFLIVYGLSAYYFSHRMVRLILLTAPIASVGGGICLGRLAVWMVSSALDLFDFFVSSNTSTNEKSTFVQSLSGAKSGNTTEKKIEEATEKEDKINTNLLRPMVLLLRLAASVFLIKEAYPYAESFHTQAHYIATQISHPTIIQKGRTKDGTSVLIDDYREAYFWLRDNTPEDARILAWWDYGYQITGIANRTTIADGNTWNHEGSRLFFSLCFSSPSTDIALLGRILTAPEKDGHRIARHLADYVLVWAGGGGDDVAKSPHLRRIANSVYRGLCREPTCKEFGYYSDHSPSDDLSKSLLYKLHSNGLVAGVEADRNRFQEKFTSKHGKVRIYKILSVSKESKEWVLKNRICDAPGSWFCRGQYPPGLNKVLAEKKDFAQLEDFNIKGKGEDDSDYQREYFENLLGEKKNRPKEQKHTKKDNKLTATQIDIINEDWHDNEYTSLLQELIREDLIEELGEILLKNPQLAHIRSEDGSGPMFWAHEYKRPSIIEMLKILEVSESRTDANGKTPLDR